LRAGIQYLAGHLVSQGDALGLSGQDHVKLRGFLQQRGGAGLGQLHITEHDEGGNVQMVIDLADGKFTGQTRDMQSIGISHDSYLISF